jgi:sugar phosphate isomerase/epimerase
MQALRELEIGTMFWAGRDPLETIRELKSLGARCGQMGIPGDFQLAGAAEGWKAALDAEGFPLVTVFAAFTGEDYADIPTVIRTVGFIPKQTRSEREARTRAISDFAKALGVTSIALHVGFVPEDTSDPDYVAVREMVRRICDHAAATGQTFALETGQEPAHVLLKFFEDVGRATEDQLRSANLILYGCGDRRGLGLLGKHVCQYTARTATGPQGCRGRARHGTAPGSGTVGMERFVAKLKEIGYKGTINVEREGQSPEQWLEDVRMGIELLTRVRG